MEVVEKEEEEEAVAVADEEYCGETQQQLHNRRQRLRNRLKLAVIATAEREVQKHEMQISPQVMTALADLTFKYAEELAKDVELFAHHAGRKSVMVDDVLLAAHRNEDVVAKLRAFARSLTRSREHQPEKKRKRAPTKEPDACA